MKTANGSALAEREGAKTVAEISWDRIAANHTEPPISDDDLETILAFGTHAPSGFNLQPWRFVVVRDPTIRDLLRNAVLDPEKIGEDSAVIVAFGRRHGWKDHIDEIIEADVECGAIEPEEAATRKRQALAFVASLPIDVWLNRHVMVAFTHMMLSAEALGWNASPIERFDTKAVREAVNLPSDAEVVALLVLGRKRQRETANFTRLPREKIVFAERYGKRWSSPLW